MKIRTKEQLSDRLSDQLSWRKKELSAVLTMVMQRRESVGFKRAMIRSGIALLYAHFEGFVKNAATHYLEYIALQRLRYNELATPFLAICVRSYIGNMVESKKASSFAPIVQILVNNISQRAKLPFNKSIDTESNLSSKVFKEIVWCLNLDYSPYESKEKLLDKRLLKRRNYIAHGEHLQIEESEYNEIHDEVLFILNTLRNQIEGAAIDETFRKSY